MVLIPSLRKNLARIDTGLLRGKEVIEKVYNGQPVAFDSGHAPGQEVIFLLQPKGQSLLPVWVIFNPSKVVEFPADLFCTSSRGGDVSAGSPDVAS